MAITVQSFLACVLLVSAGVALQASADLSPDFYDEVCPEALLTVKLIVEAAVALEPRMGASLIRLHFHDCFVNGCDASILLDDTPTFTGEKTAGPNNNSVRGYDVIDRIKLAVNTVCLDNVVSCADILAVAARDSVVALGGDYYEVLLGRRDSTTASIDDANKNIPSPFLDLPALLSNFQSRGLGLEDLVVLSGAHTVGFSRCLLFRDRLYNESSTMDAAFAAGLQPRCPRAGGDGTLSALDHRSASSFDAGYYGGLVQMKGLLHSDQQLFRGDGGDADALVQYYSENADAFRVDFGAAMVKMGSLSPLMGSDGVIRENCRVAN
ncbi:putative cationic peroxidase 1 [Iris pallida]|uniref:Peroxidase n=1 Tax=Iris pallida TaxID=29817 RepID=A0AAX6EIZ9_IRIPA|nr:putative cationic peroxidase 1 [Iris pallida]KAJ6803928.1 putative cationic peroxidase 1 [Iris pallida]